MTDRVSIPEMSSLFTEMCNALSADDRSGAVEILERGYPFVPFVATKRSYGTLQMMQVFLRDGFIDRYSGQRLITPPVLRLISEVLPDVFPYHPHGKMDVCHIAYWEVFPSVDHLDAASRGGADDKANWVTTSMAKNLAKRNFSLSQLGWELHEPGQLEDWDGLTGWFLKYVDERPEYLQVPYLKRWHSATLRAYLDPI